MGHEFYLPLDRKISTLPDIFHNQTESTLEYLKQAYYSRNISPAILKILIKDRRSTYRDRINSNIKIIALK